MKETQHIKICWLLLTLVLERSQIKSLSFHLEDLKKEEQLKLIISRRKEVINIRAEEINNIAKTMKKISEGKRKINNLDRLIHVDLEKREGIQIIDTSNDSGDLTTDLLQVKKR